MSRQFSSFLKAYILESLRNSVELFFSVLFPIVFLVIFGFMFSDTSPSNKTLGVFFDREIYYSELEKLGNWKLKSYSDTEQLLTDIKNGKIPLGVVVKDENVILYYSRSEVSILGDMKILQSSLVPIVEKALNSAKQYLAVNVSQISQTGIDVSEFDYMMMGVIALSLFSNGMFSMVTVFGRYKKQNVLKRLMTTGADPMNILVSISFVRLVMSFISLAMILFISKLIFRSNIQFNWFFLVPSIVFVTLGMMAIGILIVVLLKNPNAASNAASVMNVIMVFFSGIYFPVRFMPPYIRWIAHISPVKYAADLLRFAANAQQMSFAFYLIVNSVFFACGIIGLIFSSKMFMKPE